MPGSSEKMLSKSQHLNADTIVYDLEDSVARHQKDAARNMVHKALRCSTPTNAELAVRINAPSISPAVAQSDLDAVLPSERLQALVLPKVESAEDIELIARSAVNFSTYTKNSPLALVLSIESAASLLRMPAILEHISGRMATYQHKIRIAALMFASEDYCASTGIRRSRNLQSLLFPRAHLVTVAKAYGLQAIDMVCIEYKDDAYLREECLDGASLGFDGKQAIHPAQLGTIHQVYSPSEKDISMAKAIVHAYEKGVRENKGAVGLSHEGQDVMIDAPMLLQAKRTLERASLSALEKASDP